MEPVFLRMPPCPVAAPPAAPVLAPALPLPLTAAIGSVMHCWVVVGFQLHFYRKEPIEKLFIKHVLVSTDTYTFQLMHRPNFLWVQAGVVVAADVVALGGIWKLPPYSLIAPEANAAASLIG